MQVDAIYENGMVKLPDELRFKHQRFALGSRSLTRKS